MPSHFLLLSFRSKRHLPHAHPLGQGEMRFPEDAGRLQLGPVLGEEGGKHAGLRPELRHS